MCPGLEAKFLGSSHTMLQLSMERSTRMGSLQVHARRTPKESSSEATRGWTDSPPRWDFTHDIHHKHYFYEILHSVSRSTEVLDWSSVRGM